MFLVVSFAMDCSDVRLHALGTSIQHAREVFDKVKTALIDDGPHDGHACVELLEVSVDQDLAADGGVGLFFYGGGEKHSKRLRFFNAWDS